jgi:hypothetical protein
MQIAGNRCRVCGSNITFSSEGKYCPRCQAFAHMACSPQDTCDVCGQAFERYEVPKFDPVSDAIVPSALRPSKAAGLVIAAGLILLLALLFFMVWFGLL